jgi:hypothetical protein
MKSWKSIAMPNQGSLTAFVRRVDECVEITLTYQRHQDAEPQKITIVEYFDDATNIMSTLLASSFAASDIVEFAREETT